MGSAADFDFWLGTWRASWGDDGAHGTNTITKEYGGRVIYERFDGRPGADFTGMSVSVYDEAEDCWRQTWVDDAGNYFDLVGRFENGEMTLLCHERYRMRFFDIGPDAFKWSWERCAGNRWKLAWAIDYERASAIPDTSDYLEPISNEEFEGVRGAVSERLYHLISAYRREMIVARNDEERELLGEIERLLGPRAS